jgi:hypothetical protein
MHWALHQPQVRFDARAERAEYEHLFNHQARVLQDRLVRLGGGDRTKEIPMTDWEREHQRDIQARKLLSQARVLGWGREKSYYFAHKLS